jgi:hypothetical protein
MNLFKIKSFRGGIADWENVGIAGSFKNGSNLDIRRSTDSLTCNQALTDDLAVAGAMDALCNFIVPCSDGNSYFGLANGKILKRTSAGTYSLVYTDAGGAILGMAEWGQNNGKSYIFWCTSTALHSKEIPGLANWSDTDATITATTYPKVITAATWHTMKQINGTLLFCNLDHTGMISYDTSYTNAALDLIPGNSAKCLMEHKGYAYIGNTKIDSAQNAEMFVWDTAQSLNWNAKNTVPTNAINAMINAEYPLMQVGTSGQILLADITAYTLPIVSFPGGGQVNPDGVELDGAVALFGSYGNGTGKTGVYSYGRKKKNANLSLNLEYAFDCTAIGSVKKVGTDLLISYSNVAGTGFGVKKVNTAAKAIGTYESIDLEFPISLREQVLSKIRVVTAPLPSGSSISCKRKMNKTGSFVTANLEGGGTTFNTATATEAWFLVGDYGKIAEVQLTLTPVTNSAPEVYRIELYFE